MMFVVRQVALKADGSEIVRQSEVVGEEIFIGRNASNGVHLPDLAVNPVHARIARRGSELTITAQSQQPFDIDGRSVEATTVESGRGAELRFGGHIVQIGAEGDNITLTVRRVEAVSDSAEDKDEGAIYSLKGLLPGKRMSAWGFAILILIAMLAWPIYTWSSYKDLAYKEKATRPAAFHADGMWSSGKLSLAHKTLKDDCQSCHVDAFVSVRDNACMTCHEKDASPHAPMERQLSARGDPTGFAAFRRFVAASFNKPAGRCVECHTEHEGAGAMEATQQRFCADCHDGMDTRLTNTKLDNAADFGNAHPQFQPAVLVKPLRGDDTKAPRKRISLDKNPKENNGLKFPHDMHLSKTNGVAQMGRRLATKHGFGDALECSDCHKADKNNVGFLEVDMEESCAMCHSLSFDKIGGTYRTLRHGEPDMVKADLRAFYRSTAPARPINLGSLARQRPGAVNARRTAGDYARAVNFRGTRADQAIRQVFSRGGACYDCHVVTPPSSSGGLDFQIAPVAQTKRYLQKGWFTHDAHDKEECTSCHLAEKSSEASDLLIPGIKNCRTCHVGETGESLIKVKKPVESTCAMCHDYHADKGAPWLLREQDKKKKQPIITARSSAHGTGARLQR
ncbi:cytochrome c3 family protein [Blastomonas sp.]|uniref:cytochrome c3 family protein n=1 Tax=Blastomonas sp. TaxID=1909299 RepID=UPI003594822C